MSLGFGPARAPQETTYVVFYDVKNKITITFMQREKILIIF